MGHRNNSAGRINQRRENALVSLKRNVKGEKAQKFPEAKAKMQEEIATLESRIR
jgi:hypothetical protein